MSPLPSQIRIIRALKLQPMTVAELSRCLSLNYDAVYMQLYRMMRRRRVKTCGVRDKKKNRMPGFKPYLWGLR